MSKIGDMAMNMGMGVVGQAANAGLGILLGRSQEKHNDERQLEQQRKLQDLQLMGQKYMTDYNFTKQMEMWEKTNYAAQKGQMLKAGLNPALIYGMGGGGGATSNITQGNVGGADAPKGGHETYDQQAIGMGIQQQMMQLQLLGAQKANIEADTANKQANTTYTGGAQTQETNTRIQSLEQGIDNQKQLYEIQKLEITLKNIENFEKQATQEDRMDYIEYQTKIAMKQLDNVTSEAFINKSTVNQKIDIIKQEAIGAILRNGLTKAQTAGVYKGIEKTTSDINVNNQQIKESIQRIMREWDELSNDNKRLMLQQLGYQDASDPVNKAMDQITQALDNVFIITKTVSGIPPVRNPIGFKK